MGDRGDHLATAREAQTCPWTRLENLTFESVKSLELRVWGGRAQPVCALCLFRCFRRRGSPCRERGEDGFVPVRQRRAGLRGCPRRRHRPHRHRAAAHPYRCVGHGCGAAGRPARPDQRIAGGKAATAPASPPSSGRDPPEPSASRRPRPHCRAVCLSTLLPLPRDSHQRVTREPARSVLTGPHKWCSRSHHRVTEWPANRPLAWGSKLKAGPVPQAKLGTWAWEEGGTEASEAGVSALPGPMAVGELVGPGQVAPGAQSTGPDRETVSPSAREPGSRHLPECSSLPMNAGVTHGHAGDPRPGRPGQEAARLP